MEKQEVDELERKRALIRSEITDARFEIRYAYRSRDGKPNFIRERLKHLVADLRALDERLSANGG